MTIEGKRMTVREYCLRTPCNKCKLRNGGWEHTVLTPHNYDDRCLDIPEANESELDKALALINPEDLGQEEKKRAVQNYCNRHVCGKCKLAMMFDDGGCGMDATSEKEWNQAYDVIHLEVNDYLNQKIEKVPEPQSQEQALEAYQAETRQGMRKLYVEGIANPGLIGLSDRVKQLKEQHNGKFEEEEAKEILGAILHSAAVYCCTQGWDLKDFFKG